MTKPKKSEPNQIEEAIGERAKDPTPSTLRDVPDQPLTQDEMLGLEELNRQTEERLQDQPEKEIPPPVPPEPTTIVTPKSPIPALKPDLPPQAIKTCTPESPPQVEMDIDEADKTIREELPKAIEEVLSSEEAKPHIKNIQEAFEHIGKLPVEDKHLTALREHIMGTGFTVSGVAFHIVALCSQPMTVPVTTSWDFKDRPMIPEMVFALLRQPGYLESIWPCLKVVMADNRGNAIWTAGIATTIALFDVIRTLPALKEMQNDVGN